MAYEKPRKRKVNQKGRNPNGPRFIQLFHYLLDSEAWRSLKPPARALYIEIERRFNGVNNGEISLSVREAAKLIRVSRDTASRAFHDLEEKGLVRREVCGSFDWKIRHATTWVLTEKPLRGDAASKEFMRWRRERKNPGPKTELQRQASMTTCSRRLRKHGVTILAVGLFASFFLQSRSVRSDTYTIPSRVQLYGFQKARRAMFRVPVHCQAREWHGDLKHRSASRAPGVQLRICGGGDA